MKKLPLIVIAAIIILIALSALLFLNINKPQVNSNLLNNNAQPNPPQTQARIFIMSLEEQNGSKQQGTARVSEVDGGKIKVELNLLGGTNYNVTQPAHIHTGSCPNPGSVKYKLNNLLAGASETIIDISIDALLSSGALAINVHESDAKMSSYVACGNLPELE